MGDQYVKTHIESMVDGDKVNIVVESTKGDFNGFVKEKETEFRINVTSKPKKVIAKINVEKVHLKKVKSMEKFNAGTNVYYYNPTPSINQFDTKGSEFEKVNIIKNPQLLVKVGKTDISQNRISLHLTGYKFNTEKH